MPAIRECTIADTVRILNNLERPPTWAKSLTMTKIPLVGSVLDKITNAFPFLTRTNLATAAIWLPPLASAAALVYTMHLRNQRLIEERNELESERQTNNRNLELLQITQQRYIDLVRRVERARAQGAGCWIVQSQNASFEMESWKSDLYIKEVNGKYLACHVGSGGDLSELADIDLYRCTVCWGIFDEGEYTTLLPCAHRLHTACVKGLVKHNLLKCPRCTKGFELQAHLSLVEGTENRR